MSPAHLFTIQCLLGTCDSGPSEGRFINLPRGGRLATTSALGASRPDLASALSRLFSCLVIKTEKALTRGSLPSQVHALRALPSFSDPIKLHRLYLRTRVLWETLIRRSRPNLRNCVISSVLPRQSIVAVRDPPLLSLHDHTKFVFIMLCLSSAIYPRLHPTVTTLEMGLDGEAERSVWKVAARSLFGAASRQLFDCTLSIVLPCKKAAGS